MTTGQEEKTKTAIESTFEDIKAIVPTRELRAKKIREMGNCKKKTFSRICSLKRRNIGRRLLQNERLTYINKLFKR